MDQASEGMSCWILAMISSMTLRGSRMELAVFTMSVRMASRWAVLLSWRRHLLPAGRGRSRERAASRWASTSQRGRIAGAPGAEVEVEAEAARAAQDAAASQRREMLPTGLRGSAARSACRSRGAARAAQLHQRPLEAPRRAGRRGRAVPGGKNS